MDKIVPFYVMDLLARAKELEARGRSVIHMEVGEPDFKTAGPVVEAGKRALDAGHTGYTPATGIPPLKEAIARHYRDWFGVDVDPRRIIITPGSSGALQLILGVLVDPGREVLMTDPGYPCNKNFVEFFSGVPKPLAVGPENGYQLDSEQVANGWTESTCAALVATPSNPTGTLLPREEMSKIHGVVNSKGGTLIVDEIYQGLVYDTNNYTALSLGDDLFVLNRFLPTTGVLIHYLQVRQSVGGIRNANLFDETDHLGAYIQQNRFDMTLREQMDGGADMVVWDPTKPWKTVNGKAQEEGTNPTALGYLGDDEG